MQNSETPGGHAVDAPVGIAMVVADRYGESPVIRPDEVDDRTLGASDLQRLPLARVRRLVPWFWKEWND